MEKVAEFLEKRETFEYRRKRYYASHVKFVKRDNAVCVSTDDGPLWLRPNEVVKVLK